MLCKCRGRTEEEGKFLFSSRLKGEAPGPELWISLDTLVRVRSTERRAVEGKERQKCWYLQDPSTQKHHKYQLDVRTLDRCFKLSC